jgi:hypothetical protein
MAENNDDSVDIIFEVLQKEYEAEESRNKHLETKAQIMLALCGIIISANMFLLKVVIESRYLLINTTLLFFVLMLITYAIYELLKTIKIRTFEKIDHNVLSSKDTFKLTRMEIKSKLIYDYNKCIKASFRILDSKVNSIKYSANLIEVAVVIFSFVLLIILVSNYFERSIKMPKNNSTTSGTKTKQTTQTTQTTIKPSQNGRSEPMTESSNNKGDGFGTITVERGHKK